MKRRTVVAVLVLGALLAVAVAGAAFATSDRSLPGGGPSAPLDVARFSLVIDGVEIAAFSDLVGLSSGVDPTVLLTTDGAKSVKTLLPNKREPDTLVLRRGLTTSAELSAWHQLVVIGDIIGARKSATLVMFSTDGLQVARYHLENAWPAKLEVAGLRSGATSQVTETVTLVCDQIQRISV